MPFLILVFLFASSCASSFQTKKGQINSPQAINAPYVLLISIDGYRHDYTKKFSPKNINEFFEEGSKAKSLIPSFPSKTFPNHYTIATGLYPENHGIVSNTFYDFTRPKEKNLYRLNLKSAVTDGSWYGGIPLWVAAEQQQMLSATYFWPGSEATIDGTTPTYLKTYDGKIPNDERVDTILKWLNLKEEVRPHFLTLYFSDVDNSGHLYGTDSSEIQNAVLKVDQSLGKLFEGLKKLPFSVNVILVSDHGMEDLDDNKVYYLDDYTDLKQLAVGDFGPLLSIYSEELNQELISKTYQELKTKKKGKNFNVYYRSEVPANLHFSKNKRIGDIVVIADAPYSLGVRDSRFNLIKGNHGYPPHQFSNMQAIFYAKGPNIKKGKTISSFENIHIYPFIMSILGLKIKNEIDGKAQVLAPILKK